MLGRLKKIDSKPQIYRKTKRECLNSSLKFLANIRVCTYNLKKSLWILANSNLKITSCVKKVSAFQKIYKIENRSGGRLSKTHFKSQFSILSTFLHCDRNNSIFFEKLRLFPFSSHTEYGKRGSIIIAWVKQKNSLLLTNVHVLYVLEDKTSKKKFPSVCLSVWDVCLSVWLSGCAYVDFSCGHNNFRWSYRIQTKFGGCLLCLHRVTSWHFFNHNPNKKRLEISVFENSIIRWVYKVVKEALKKSEKIHVVFF